MVDFVKSYGSRVWAFEDVLETVLHHFQMTANLQVHMTAISAPGIRSAAGTLELKTALPHQKKRVIGNDPFIGNNMTAYMNRGDAASAVSGKLSSANGGG